MKFRFIIILIFMSIDISSPAVASANAVINTKSFGEIRKMLLQRREVALVDVREEAIFAEGHPLFAVNISLSKLELEVYQQIPRRNTPIVVYDNGEGLAIKAARKLVELGYIDVSLLEGGLAGWKLDGGELFIDVNAPSKAFGELVEAKRHTPMLSAEEVQRLIQEKAKYVIVDARRFDEYNTMNIPGSISVPGAELVLRIRELAPDPETKVIVNCAGRTRSIIGTQSLINAGIPNQVVALRNGTIGWTLAGLQLEHGQSRHFSDVSDENRNKAIFDSYKVAAKAGVNWIAFSQVENWLADGNRTTYLFDVRTPEEFSKGHLPSFLSAPGGQLVQETDHFASVRGARIVLVDDQNVRANMTASWLAQMGWEVYILKDIESSDFTETGIPAASSPVAAPENEARIIKPGALKTWLDEENNILVVDLSESKEYRKGHIPGAWFAIRSQFDKAISELPRANKYILTSSDGRLAKYALEEFQALTSSPVYVLDGGTNAWVVMGYPLRSAADEVLLGSPEIDRYKRPYEGTNNAREAMEAYLEWEYGLVDQLRKDATHGFFVIQ
jgi:rhodanese-related sulfurtransferase